MFRTLARLAREGSIAAVVTTALLAAPVAQAAPPEPSRGGEIARGAGLVGGGVVAGGAGTAVLVTAGTTLGVATGVGAIAIGVGLAGWGAYKLFRAFTKKDPGTISAPDRRPDAPGGPGRPTGPGGPNGGISRPTDGGGTTSPGAPGSSGNNSDRDESTRPVDPRLRDPLRPAPIGRPGGAGFARERTLPH